VIRNVIFDWSGTLVNDLPAVWQATNAVFRRAGVPELALEAFRAQFTLPFTDFYARFVPHVPPVELERWFHEEFRQCESLVTELPHARDLLQFCRGRGIRTFLLSALHRDHFARQASVNGFDHYLDHPYLGVWDKRAQIHELLTTHGAEPGETLFVGDMQHDIESGRHGGVHTCAVLTGYNSLDQLRAASPDLIVEHLGELRQLLEGSDLDLDLSDAARLGSSDTKPTVTVGALIFDDAGRALMIRTQKWSGLWGIPGGKVKWSEPCLDALLREVREETRLELRDVEFVFVQDCIHSGEFYRDAHFVLLNYTGRCVGEARVVLNDEAQEYRWVDLVEALALPLNQPTRRLIEVVHQRRGRAGEAADLRPAGAL
jgi:phosphoglycolate phosphatase-like HAD superfamily hydrolase/ADP-ribose pyrophosphatase YjhB (NUDIX family)